MSLASYAPAGVKGASSRTDASDDQSGHRLRRRLLVSVIAVIGVTASLGAHVMTKESDRQSRQEHFARLAQEQTDRIQANVMTTVITLRSIRGLFDASQVVERDGFRAFVQSLDLGASVQALEWIPRVEHAMRRDFVQAARQDGFPDFDFSERTSEGAMARAGDRADYFPVYFVEPYAGNEAALGFDLASNATRLAALDKARASGHEVATARITLVQETGEQYGFLIFIPIYLDGTLPDTASKREADLIGFGLGVFRIGDLVSSALSEDQSSTAPIDIHVFDQTAQPGNQLLYPKNSVFENSNDLQSALRHETALHFASRDWLIIATPAEGSVFNQKSLIPWLVLLLGLTITGLVAVCFGVITGRAEYANQLVTFRTAELVSSNQERLSILQKLTKTNEELESFAYVASHDLKAPLRGIDNLVSWIVEDPDSRLSQESQHNASRLRGRVTRLEALLDGLLAYSRAGRLKSEVESVDTRLLGEQIAEYLAPPEGFAISIAPDMPVFDTIKPALETVLRNLVSNAVQHHDREEGRIEVSASDRGDAYQFTVRDDGPGIDPAFHDRVFEIFQTLVPRSKVDSSGIGLSIVKRILEAAGGSIRIESNAEERGTVFHFTWMKTWRIEED